MFASDAPERDADFIRHDCKDRISKLEALLEESAKEKDELRGLVLKLTEQEVTELNNKITQKDNIINSLNQKDSLSSVIITKTEEKFKIVYDENENIRKDMKKMRTKHIIVESITGFISATLIYIIAFK